jgi:hypothetical protein
LSELGEEASKISERASDEVGFERGMPVPNLNKGNCASGLDLWGMEVVLKPLALDNVGRKGLDLLLSCGNCSVMFSTGAGLNDRGVRQSGKIGSVGVWSGVGDCRPVL